MKGNFDLPYYGIIAIIVGAFCLINYKTLAEPDLNLKGGVIFLSIGILLIWRFIRQNKSNGQKDK